MLTNKPQENGGSGHESESYPEDTNKVGEIILLTLPYFVGFNIVIWIVVHPTTILLESQSVDYY